MYQKNQISLISGTLKTLKLTKKQVHLFGSDQSSFPTKIQSIPNFEQLQTDFRKVVQTLPDGPGILVVSGSKSNSNSVTLKVFRSSESLKETLLNFNQQPSFFWIKNLFINDQFKSIHFQLATISHS
jgi:hypothetical protein